MRRNTQIVPTIVKHGSPFGRGRLSTQTQKAQSGGRKYRRSHAQRDQDNNWSRKTYMRFDLNDLIGVEPADLAGATLQLNFIDSGAGSTPAGEVFEFELYGLNHGDAGEDWLESKVIRIVDKGDDYVLSTPGPGKMRARFAPAKDGSEPAILGLNWPGRMEFDGSANKAVFESTADELVTGAWVQSLQRHSKLEGKKLELFLRNKQSAKPDEKPSPGGASGDLISSEPFFKPMGGKSLEKMILTGQAKVRAIEEAADGSKKRLRSALLTSSVLTYQVVQQAGRFHGEGPGTLLLEDNRPTDEKVLDESTGGF